MHFILKTTPGMTYTELWIGDHAGQHPHLAGHFNLSLAEQNVLADTLRMGVVETRHTYTAIVRQSAEHAERQHEVDRVFEEAAKGQTLAVSLGPQGVQVAVVPVSVPDPMGRALNDYARGRELPTDAPKIPGLDGTEQTCRIREYREEQAKNAQQGATIDAGGLSAPAPIPTQGEPRFVAVKGPGADSIDGFCWNSLDRTTGRYRMPGWVMSEGAARTSAERANRMPDVYGPRYQWAG